MSDMASDVDMRTDAIDVTGDGGVLKEKSDMASDVDMRTDAIDVTGDGGVLKEVLVAGHGNAHPQKNDEVSVHYVGTLQSDGSKFDSSRDKDTPFKFKLGMGSVIKGWDAGVATMKRGEKAIFTIRSDYGYGDTGSGKIPAGATLIFEVELLSWNEIDITGDGKVSLKHVEKGTGYKTPGRDDEVTIKWEGRFNGVVFSSSSNNDFELVKLGAPGCPVPNGVQKAICKEIKKGGKAIITLADAYGEEGMPDAGIPAGAVVEFEVELKDWNTVHDVSKDGGILVKVLGQTDSYSASPDDAATVTVKVEGKVLPDGPVFMGPEEKTLRIGDGELPDGLERGLEKVKKDQSALITCQPRYAYGDAGNSQLGVAPNSAVEFSVTVTDVTPTYSLSLSEKLSAAEHRKQMGNDSFKAGDLERALGKYDKALKLIEYENGEGEEANQVKEIKAVLHLNKAAVYDKQQRYADIIDNCNKVLEASNRNVKALFRRGKAYSSIGKLDEALKDFKSALEIEPVNASVKNQVVAVRKKMKEQSEKDKLVFGKMFASPPVVSKKLKEDEAPIIEQGESTPAQEAPVGMEVEAAGDASAQ